MRSWLPRNTAPAGLLGDRAGALLHGVLLQVAQQGPADAENGDAVVLVGAPVLLAATKARWMRTGILPPGSFSLVA